MTQYLLSVHGPVERAEFGNYGSKEPMEAASMIKDPTPAEPTARSRTTGCGGSSRAATPPWRRRPGSR